MWTRCESVAFSERHTAGQWAKHPPPHCPPLHPRPSLPPPRSWKLCCRIPSAQPLGEEHKTQVPKAIIKLPEPFLLLLNLLVANPANNTLGWPSVKVIITAAGLLSEREGANKTGSLRKLWKHYFTCRSRPFCCLLDVLQAEKRKWEPLSTTISRGWLYSKRPAILICSSISLVSSICASIGSGGFVYFWPALFPPAPTPPTSMYTSCRTPVPQICLIWFQLISWAQCLSTLRHASCSTASSHQTSRTNCICHTVTGSMLIFSWTDPRQVEAHRLDWSWVTGCRWEIGLTLNTIPGFHHFTFLLSLALIGDLMWDETSRLRAETWLWLSSSISLFLSVTATPGACSVNIHVVCEIHLKVIYFGQSRSFNQSVQWAPGAPPTTFNWICPVGRWTIMDSYLAVGVWPQPALDVEYFHNRPLRSSISSILPPSSNYIHTRRWEEPPPFHTHPSVCGTCS